MVRGKGTVVEEKPKEILSHSELQGLQEEKHDLESSIRELKDADGSSRAGAVDIANVQAKIRRIDNAIEQRTAPKVGYKIKDSLHAEEAEIEDKLVVGMPTRYEMDHPARCPGAVRKHMAWDARNKHLILRYVEIQRILRPEEPKSVEELRKDK